MSKLWTVTCTFYLNVNLYMQYILVMRNNRLINKCVLFWYVDVLVSILPFRKISRAPLVILSYLSCYLHAFRRDHGYGWMYFAGSREFQDLSWQSQSTQLLTHTHTITQATSHKQSMLYLVRLEIQENH